MYIKYWFVTLIALAFITPLMAAGQDGFELEILVNSNPAPEYSHNGKNYIEAIKDREYSIRLRNPFNRRVAVALAVDGLNTIDARHTTALNAKKWILGPYETILIEGWQVNQKEAKRFFFTSEEKSYGKWLGHDQDLGGISAVFYKEKICVEPHPTLSLDMHKSRAAGNVKEGGTTPMKSNEAADRSSMASNEAAVPAPKKEEYAATGMGQRSDHPIQWVSMELEPTPAATISLRYEFRPVLVKMGILPAPFSRDPFYRREQAQGFKDHHFCPEPK
jgi:hypothetical protein